MMISKILTSSILATTLLGISALDALAAAPKFQRATGTVDGSGNLVVSFTETGLGNGDVNYLASASANAVYVCATKSGQVPNADNKKAETGYVSVPGTFSSGKNGRIDASLTLVPPASTLNCPPGQTATLYSVTYTSVTIADTTNNVSTSVSGGPFTYTNSKLKL